MKRFGGWLNRDGQSAEQNAAPAFDELKALHDAMQSSAMVMNDEYEEAEEALSKDNSPFHKLGKGCVYFLKSLLGMEKEVIARGVQVLADSEATALEYHKRALRDPSSANQSAIYPPGTEYALAHAESQLMFAVVAILNASLTEGLRGLYKLRKAYSTLNGILEAEKKYLKSIGHSGSSIKSATRPASRSSSIVQAPSIISRTQRPGTMAPVGEEDDDDGEEFFDASEDLSHQPTAHQYQGRVGALSSTLANGAEKADGQVQPSADAKTSLRKFSLTSQEEDDFDFRSVTSDPVDLFIHSGLGLSLGTFQLALSMVPPPFDTVLSFLSFKGDRKTGLGLLWSSTKFIENVNGALASLITLVFHNGPIAFCNIKFQDAMPIQRLDTLLHNLRTLYPRSQIWQLEEAVMLSEARQLQPALKVLTSSTRSPLKSIEAIGVFELGLHFLYAHDYEACARSFIELLDLSDWSHGLYYYIAGIAYVDHYRATKSFDAKKAEQHKAKAIEYLGQVTSNLGLKKVLGQGLPIEELLKRKMAKYTARAAARKVDIVEAIGVSPAEDIIYMWGGYDCMPDADLRISLERLTWVEASHGWAAEPTDEKTVLSVLKATCLRGMGQYEKARAEYEQGVLSYPWSQVKGSGRNADLWAQPIAHFELAVCIWQQAGGEWGDKTSLQECGDHINKAARWGTFEMETTHNLKIATAAETLRKLGIKV